MFFSLFLSFFLLLLRFIDVIYMRALKDDARFDLSFLFIGLMIVYMHEISNIYMNDKLKERKKRSDRIIIELKKSFLSWDSRAGFPPLSLSGIFAAASLFSLFISRE